MWRTGGPSWSPRRPPSRPGSRGALVVAGTGLAQAATTNPNPGPLEKANAALSKEAATQGMVLLENNDSALPMASSGTVAVYGVGAYATVKGGTGSGAVNNRSSVSVRQGLENAGYQITTDRAYSDAVKTAFDAKYGNTSGGGIFGPTIDYSSVEQRLTRTTVQPTAPTDTALYVLSRNSGEGADRSSGAGDYQLTDLEKDDLQLIGQTYGKVVVVLNVGGVVDTAFFDQINAAAVDPDGGKPLDSMLLMSQAGQEGGTALTEVLNGTVTPLGQAHRHLGVEVLVLPGLRVVREQRRQQRRGAVHRGHLRRVPVLRLDVRVDQPRRPGERRRLPLRLRSVVHAVPGGAARRHGGHVVRDGQGTRDERRDGGVGQGRRPDVLLGPADRTRQAVPAARGLGEDRQPRPPAPRRPSPSGTTPPTWRRTTRKRPRT
ncbi:glycoside hydrolase family 3 C-terminal domain-containing protein [Curtobacterium sp. MCJR17_043]|uniref:glycoside hydrolase family 3 C-terminal domain-containing protein n=1 Tax=Curtobacterium sp. MCJR17_043 TaxID=2175660 RepID=UPI0024DF40D9|nr:glycoside hydrolase family 3 C-terminal domain-containing protein [Curtobacterium sp. MCJR17_043]WIB36278.1 glycoside hydrolase family 3 C-terminal domain-containing protein [Curtobacterium sp. MCJR17_043]